MAHRASIATTRLQDVKGALAVLVLEQRAQRGRKQVELVLELPYVSAKTYAAAREFMARVAPDVRFRLDGKDGSGATPTDATHLRQRRPRATANAASGRSGAEFFSAMNQWLLKVLLLRKDARARTLVELSGTAEVSLPTAQRFVRTFREAGHLIATPDGYSIVRRGELMRRWFATSETRLPSRIPVRSLFGQRALLAALASRAEAGSGAGARGGFAACRALRVLHVVDPGPIEIHVDESMLRLAFEQAVACEPRDADAILLPARGHDEAPVFRPIRWQKRMRGGELPSVDLIQAALDVWRAPLAGREQATYIVEDVLGWRDD